MRLVPAFAANEPCQANVASLPETFTENDLEMEKITLALNYC